MIYQEWHMKQEVSCPVDQNQLLSAYNRDRKYSLSLVEVTVAQLQWIVGYLIQGRYSGW